MSQAKRASKGKRPSKAVSVLGIAGASLAASAGGSLAAMSVADLPSQNTVPFQFLTLGEEEISDVSLATFHLFDKEGLGTPRSGLIQLARGGCGCGHGGGCGRGGGCGHGIGGCGHGFGGCRGCRGCGGRGCGRGCGWGGCGGCGWGGGWGGCCLSWGGCYIC
jgi:hypothetical protein